MRDCSCIYVDSSGHSTWDFFSEKIVGARKPHTCCECHRIIVPGEKYEYATGLTEGEFLVFKTCTDCLSIRNVFFCDGWEFGGSLEYLEEFFDGNEHDTPWDLIGQLTPQARAMICEIIERKWEKRGEK